MSTRAIASATGVDRRTLQRNGLTGGDIAATSGTRDVTGTDGKTYSVHAKREAAVAEQRHKVQGIELGINPAEHGSARINRNSRNPQKATTSTHTRPLWKNVGRE